MQDERGLTMARIRTLKPEFWADEKLSPLSPIDRLVFIGLISQADDAGRLVDNVRLIDGLLFPCTDDTCRDSLDTLARLSRVTRYRSASGQRILQIANWPTHQHVDRPSKYVLPGPAPEVAGATHVTKHSRESRETIAIPSRDTRAPIPDPRSGIIDPRSPIPDPTTSPPVSPPKRRTAARAALTQSTDGEWNEIRGAYPARSGGQGWTEAEQRYRRHRARGVPHAEILEGVQRYAAYVRETEKEGTDFVKQAATFLGPGCHWKEAYAAPSENGRAPATMADALESDAAFAAWAAENME